MKAQAPTISFLQRSNKKRKDGTCAVYLQVYFDGAKRIYATNISLMQETFAKAWKQKSPRGQYKEIQSRLQAIKKEAEETAGSLEPFTFDKFETKYFRQSGTDVFSLFRDKINQLKKERRWRSATAYNYAANAIQKFLIYKGKKPEPLAFEDITIDFLKEFELYFTHTRGKSISTVGVYTRHLKAIFNDARDKGYTNQYPFGKRNYQTPNARKAKRALKADELKSLLSAEPQDEYQEKAKDFFTLSLVLYGINLNDLLTLRNKDMGSDQIAFYRGKTAHTTRENLTPIKIPLTEKAKQLLSKYKNHNIDPDSLVLNVLEAEPGTEEAKRQIDNTKRFINQHLKSLAKANDLPQGISYQWARHTFATLSVQNGASLEFISEALGHNDVKTTKAYFHGFENQTGKSILEKILN